MRAVWRSALGADPDDAGADPVSYRSMRLLGLAAVAVVVAGAFNSDPAPGWHGVHLGVSVAVATFAVAAIALLGLA